MELKIFSKVVLFCLVSAVYAPLSSSSFISDGVFQPQTSVTGRNLLQAMKPCPVNFEFMNYTVITGRCKGPEYPPKECCSSLKEFACPFAKVLNDLSNDCAIVMFSYIRLHGKYPPGLFAHECKESKEGLACPARPPAPASRKNAAALTSPSLWLMIPTAFLLFIELF
ncbi:PREDICTED: GPI-anchored protein LORELEI isoform X2 [Tarenaya hassleriana]|uniref:GPI-anchored protein LORELEI isoform X2 n=1 Tax=Tarenaya hassleriana TaxID=28532 RepID=UPI00053C42DB|nr:PREDICTED: GPI-anchored protein LORELEI isoform X2 [Tarenaya hassleriana]